MAKAPSFWDPRNVSNPLYVPNLQRAREEGKKAGIASASEQIKKGDCHLSLGIDYEDDFMPHGRLPVQGMYEDVERYCDRLIKGICEEYYTHIMKTFDKHPPHVVHGDTWWADEFGNPPNLSLPVTMTLDDPNPKKPAFKCNYLDGSPSKIFFPTTMRKHTIKYWNHLNATGQGDIWVFTSHCREGTNGINLPGALVEVIEWAAAARYIQPIYLYKGMIAEVDWFGPFRPCMDVPNHPQGGLQTQYLDIIKACKTTDIAGEAEDFCVNWGVRQVLDYFGNEPDVLKTIRFIGDCTSAIVPGSQVVKDLHDVMGKSGVKVITHNEPFA